MGKIINPVSLLRIGTEQHQCFYFVFLAEPIENIFEKLGPNILKKVGSNIF